MDRDKHLDLGSWIGLQKAFATVAGSCSAARAQCLKQVRDSHLLDELGVTWEEFCKDYAGISRPHADSLIRQYDQFGDAYFRLSEIARISPKSFEQIASHVDADSIEIGGEKVALTPENAPKIRAAIQTLRNQARQSPAPGRPTAGVIELQIRVDSLADDIAKAIRALNPYDQNPSLRSLVTYAFKKFRALSRQIDSNS
jgi:hypothetical protein